MGLLPQNVSAVIHLTNLEIGSGLVSLNFNPERKTRKGDKKEESGAKIRMMAGQVRI